MLLRFLATRAYPFSPHDVPKFKKISLNHKLKAFLRANPRSSWWSSNLRIGCRFRSQWWPWRGRGWCSNWARRKLHPGKVWSCHHRTSPSRLGRPTQRCLWERFESFSSVSVGFRTRLTSARFRCHSSGCCRRSGWDRERRSLRFGNIRRIAGSRNMGNAARRSFHTASRIAANIPASHRRNLRDCFCCSQSAAAAPPSRWWFLSCAAKRWRWPTSRRCNTSCTDLDSRRARPNLSTTNQRTLVQEGTSGNIAMRASSDRNLVAEQLLTDVLTSPPTTSLSARKRRFCNFSFLARRACCDRPTSFYHPASSSSRSTPQRGFCKSFCAWSAIRGKTFSLPL